MFLESIANELILDLYEYLATVDLLRAFDGLNDRFTRLLDQYFRSHPFNLQYISKDEFDRLTRDHLPRMANRLVSLRLADDDATPQGVDRFFAAGLHFQQFTRLRSLNVSQLHSSQQILAQIHHLSQLTHLYITRSSLEENPFYNADIIDAIQRLPNLTDCYLDISHRSDGCSSITSIVSPTLTSISLPYLDCHVNQFISLIGFISTLQFLQVRIDDGEALLHPLSVMFPWMKTLKIVFYGSLNALKNLLQTMPNLYRLHVVMASRFIDGYQWQSLIEVYLLKLVVLELKMFTSLSEQMNIDQLLLPFATRFWLVDHLWLVQCDWNVQDRYSLVHFYTLPYAFENFIQPDHVQSKSTCPLSARTWPYDRIQHLYSRYLPFDGSSNSPFHSRHLHSLDISFSVDQVLATALFTFERLRSLSIVLSDRLDQQSIHAKLNDLFHQSPFLDSLTIFSWSTEYLYLLDIEHRSIRRLDLQGPYSVFNAEQCRTLSRSFLGSRCEVLLLAVKEASNILDLLRSSTCLHALTVRCHKNTQLLQWLQSRLPSNCTMSSSTKDPDQVRLWIR